MNSLFTVDENVAIDESGHVLFFCDGAPPALGALNKFEDHGGGRVVLEAALCPIGSMAGGGKDTIDGI